MESFSIIKKNKYRYLNKVISKLFKLNLNNINYYKFILYIQIHFHYYDDMAYQKREIKLIKYLILNNYIIYEYMHVNMRAFLP